MEKVAINVSPLPNTGEVPDTGTVLELAKEAGWTDDPMEGHAVLLPDENGNAAYEVLHPLPIAPPIGWVPTPPIEELIRASVRREFESLKDDEEIDDIIDAEDFDVPDELPPLETMYEVIAMEPEVPAVKSTMSDEERASKQAEYEELVEKARRLAKVRSRKEYDRRVEEAKTLYGDPPPPRAMPSEEDPT